jgi:hypothetical protein
MEVWGCGSVGVVFSNLTPYPPSRRGKGELGDCLGPNSPLPYEERGVGGVRSKKPTPENTPTLGIGPSS